MVSLKLSESTYKSIGIKLILSVVLACVFLYGANYFLAYISHVDPVSSSPFDTHWGALQIVLIGLSMLLGLVAVVVIVMLTVRLLLMVGGYSKHHFILDETGISLQSPLNFNSDYYEYPQIRSISIKSKKNDTLHVLVGIETTYFMLWVTKKEVVTRGAYIKSSELTLLKNYLNKVGADIPIMSANR